MARPDADAETVSNATRQLAGTTPRETHSANLIALSEEQRLSSSYYRSIHPAHCLSRCPPSPTSTASPSDDNADDGIYAVICFVTRTGYRRRGFSRTLARTAVGFARQRVARALTRPLGACEDDIIDCAPLFA
jgi:hypothetical protein